MFPANVYLKRRQALRSRLQGGMILFLGNDESPMNYRDNAYHFRQDSTFLYYFGINNPGLAALVDLDEGLEVVFGDEATMDDIVWTGPQPSIASLAADCGVSQVLPIKQLRPVLAGTQQQGRKIHFLPPYRGRHTLQLQDLLGLQPEEQAGAVSLPLLQAVVAQRSVKSPEEITELEKAVRLSGKMHEAVMRAARPGMTEAELHGTIQAIAAAVDSSTAYPVILSVNGQILHNHDHSNTLTEGKMVLVDAGGNSPMHYAGDLTRTFPVSHRFSAQQKEIYQIVLDAELAAIEALRPGVPYRDVHLLASRVIAEGLTGLGLMRGNPEEAVAAGAHALFFPHGLGHMMGLDVHDMENFGENHVGYTDSLKRSTQFGLNALRLGRELEAGFVLTVEPGIYFIPELIDQWQVAHKHSEFINYDRLGAYRDFGGIRIEDDYIVTETGSQLLGDPVAKTISEVEALRGEMMTA